jgi:hypothetical protein
MPGADGAGVVAVTTAAVGGAKRTSLRLGPGRRSFFSAGGATTPAASFTVSA